MLQAHYKIFGHVQGVSFRAYAREEALRLNLKGKIKNMPDGSVEAILQGDETSLKQFEIWAHKGSPFSKVTDVKMDFEKSEEIFVTVKIL